MKSMCLTDIINSSGIFNFFLYYLSSTERADVDIWLKSNDQDSFLMSRRMIKEEGLLCGECNHCPSIDVLLLLYSQ